MREYAAAIAAAAYFCKNHQSYAVFGIRDKSPLILWIREFTVPGTVYITA